MTKKHARAPRKAPSPFSPPPTRTYLRAAIASMVTAPKPSALKIVRSEVSLILSVDGQPFHIESPDYSGSAHAVIVKPGIEHRLEAQAQRVARFFVHPIHPRYRCAIENNATNVKVLAREIFSHLDSALHDAFHVGVDAQSGESIIDDAINVLLAGAPPRKPPDPRVLLMLRKIDANIESSFEQLAEELGLSPSRLSHLFSQELGISFRAFHTWGRMRLAWELVAWRPAMSLTQIAYTMGFADSSHLSRAFSRSLGMTPSMIRDGGRIEVIGNKMPSGQHVPPDEQWSQA